MTAVEDLVEERTRDIKGWARDVPETAPYASAACALLGRLERMPPILLSEVADLERQIRDVEPTGLPARCEQCGIRMPMCDRHKARHPKCVTGPGSGEPGP